MEKKIKDYLHLFLGCEVSVQGEERKGYLTGVTNGGVECEIQYQLVDNPHHLEEEPEFSPIEDVKPVLRPLSSMTIEDVKEWSDNLYVTVTPYCVELDSKDHDGEFTEVYHDGSILSKSKDDGDIRPINGGELFRLLLSKHFDLFGLIESGLAIDATQQPITQDK